MNYLLDTDTLIYWMKNIPEVVNNIVAHSPKALAASVVSKAELYFGAYNSQHVEKNIQAIIRLSKAMRFLPLDDSAQEHFGRIKAMLRKQGAMLDDTDVLIASTALSSNRILITNNTRHFQRITGLKLENWFK